MRCLVTGAGGFIGGHLVKRLLEDGHEVRAVDRVLEWHQEHDAENGYADLRDPEQCAAVTQGIDWVFNLAADMGGMGFIESHKAECMLSVLISTNMLVAAKEAKVTRFFYSSSACVYPAWAQLGRVGPDLAEEMVYPADPEDGYGWEKLFSERMCRHFYEDFGLETRVARYHNVYGPHGTWEGGREKAPAAICRKVAQAVFNATSGEIEVWGDGTQLRSFTYIDDCIEGTMRLMASDVTEPLNIGSSEVVTINKLIDIVAGIAGLEKYAAVYDPTAPKGVAARNSDNTKILEELEWEPSTSLHDGLWLTYHWVYDQVVASAALRS